MRGQINLPVRVGSRDGRFHRSISALERIAELKSADFWGLIISAIGQ